MEVILIAGSPARTSRSAFLLESAQQWLAQRNIVTSFHSISDFPAEDLLHANVKSPCIVEFKNAVQRASGVVIATPVYKASFSGALKTLLDILPERAFRDKVVLPLATGGSIAHMLAVDYALGPILAVLNSKQVVRSVFADDTQILSDGSVQRLHADTAWRLDAALQAFYVSLPRQHERAILAHA